ncbi:LacI family DNA-binding transcriptional regulator [Zhihengliuella salsuginis]|nr:LacI family DNA-binding transcriptional regulator [Zhihengliuella salsuginis]
MTTIREVAQRVGVSAATVSRVVNGVPGFSELTRQRVLQAIDELGYEPDSLARGLKTSHSALLGVLAPAVSDALASQIMSGVESEARAHGHAVMLGRTGSGAELAVEYLRTLRAYRPAGVVLISTAITPEMRRAVGSRVPLVSVAIRKGNELPSVAIDDELAAYEGTMSLLRSGHRRIGLLAGDESSVLVNAPRERGYRRAMRAVGAKPLEERGNSLYESAIPALQRLWQRDPELTAIFALSDEMGAAAVNEAQRRGLRVPEDLSVLGFDDTPTSRHVHPPLSTVAQPLVPMGESAVRLLLGQGPRNQVLPHRIIARGSTGPTPMPPH